MTLESAGPTQAILGDRELTEALNTIDQTLAARNVTPLRSTLMVMLVHAYRMGARDSVKIVADGAALLRHAFETSEDWAIAPNMTFDEWIKNLEEDMQHG